MIVGLVFVAPGAIRALGLVTRRLPFAPRLALRDLVRYQARTAGAVAAITLGLGIAVSIVVLAKLNEYRGDEGNLSRRELVVRLGGGQGEGLDPDLDPGRRSPASTPMRPRVAVAVGARQVVALDVALNPATAAGQPDHRTDHRRVSRSITATGTSTGPTSPPPPCSPTSGSTPPRSSRRPSSSPR